MRASIVMATYNGEPYLKQQVDSILAGMDPEDELIIADDGSTDNTIKILESYSAKDSRIHILPDFSHKGVIGNFNYGLEYTNGDIVLLADQDDIWSPNKIHKIKNLFERDPKLTCILNDLTIIDGSGNETASSFFELRGVRPGFLNNFIKNSYIGNAMAFRSSMKKYILPMPHDIPMHDQWIGLINERYGKTLFLHEPLGAYRRHSHNVTQMRHGSISSMLQKRWTLATDLYKRFNQIGHAENKQRKSA